MSTNSAKKAKPESNRADSPEKEEAQLDFGSLARALVIAEIRTMIRRLQETGEFRLPEEVDLDKLDPRGLNYVKKQLRDTLRTLGGGR